jgi:hypothetical protein
VRHFIMIDKLFRKKLNNESGMALSMALILMAVAMFIIVPLLFFMQTTLTVNSKVTESVKAQYAAEAGVEEALWRMSTPSISPQPEVVPITLPDKINGYWVTYNVAKPTGQSYSILTSWAYANPGSENMSVVRAKMDSGQFLFSYAFSARGPASHTHTLWMQKANIYSAPINYMADLYSDGAMQFPSNTNVSGTLYARDGIIGGGLPCDSKYKNPPWGGTCSCRQLTWSQVYMWDFTPSPDGLPDSGGGITDSGNPMTVNTGASDVYIGPRHVNGNLSITSSGNGNGRLILKGPVYVDGYINKTGTQDIVDLSGGVSLLSAQEYVSLNNWKNNLYPNSGQLPIIMSVNGDITCTCATNTWICALLYAPNSPNGLTSDGVQIYGACNMSGVKNSNMTIEYPSDIKTTRNWPQVYGGTGSGQISAYSVQ